MSTIKRNTYRRPSALGVPGAPIETESESVATFTGMPGKRGSAFKAVDHLVAEGQLDSLTYNKISYAGQAGPRAETDMKFVTSSTSSASVKKKFGPGKIVQG